MNICENAATYMYCHKIINHSYWENGVICLEPGDILFVPYQIKYKLRWIGNPDAVTYSCHFNFPSFSAPFGNKDFPLQKISGLKNTKEDFAYITENMDKPEKILEVFSRFYALCGKLYPNLKFTEAKRLDERIQKAVEYLNANYFKSISVEELALISNMSTSRFYHCFKKETGMTPIEYKNSICIKQASILLLCQKKRTIEEISAASGFESSAYFRRVFKSVTGMSPREYRKAMSTAL